MMTDADWKSIRNFTPAEFSAPERMDYDFLRQLDAFRAKVGEAVLINFSNGPERHAAGSLHYEGKAVDLMFRRRVTLDDFLLATRYFTEVGLYPDWDRPDTKDREGGLHVGYERFAVSFAQQRKYWMGVKHQGITQYVSLDAANLRRYGLS
jgi:hypothetical protein